MALDALNSSSYYSAASFCFGGNVKIRNALTQNLTNNDLKVLYAKLLTNVTDFKRDLDKSSESLSTISELETYMVVAERLSEAQDVLSQMNPENISSYELAFANERFYTATVWSRFSQLSGQKFIMDKDLLRIVCSQKLSEVEERLNYLDLYYPKSDIRDELTKAYDYYNQQDYALCIFTASKVKADSDVVLSAIFVPDKDMNKLFDEKIGAAKRAIAKQERSDIFPILGYSYYEYANTLKDTDKYSSLLYAEYSLELSNLDMYFKKRDSLTLPMGSAINRSYAWIFALGFFIGVLIAVLVGLGVNMIKDRNKKNELKTSKINKKFEFRKKKK
jgi:predicted S18 family serine protease